ncbi:acetyl esterase/lipase [Nocardioides sp. J9]|uniref:alpha/beta hydrolase n=1 Tax=Nocardioides sp. J9 TaxID=935844 RepID=UPI0011A2D253|nr:alpha/beta hydrolase [Nocardioides sp. J9]TWG98596.1 acetyl esterase/lipase [Nocardioides sp. J9]
MSESEQPRPGAPARGGRRPPAPPGLSPEARDYLEKNRDFPDPPPWPPLEDRAAWRELVDTTDRDLRPLFEALYPGERLEHRELEPGGVPTYELRPRGLQPTPDEPLVLQLHGGALLMGGGELARLGAGAQAVRRAGPTWAPDYRMPPDHPFPAALDDVLAVYRAALEEHAPGRVVVTGTSAGGNLAAALVLRARDEGLPLPAGLVLHTPQLDLTESGDSFTVLDGVDLMRPVPPVVRLYADGRDPAEPYLSPLLGDVTGFPPTLLLAGTRDLFLSTTVRMHRKLLAAGVPAELHVFEAMPHGGFGGTTPEDEDLLATVAAFERRCVGVTG